MIDYLLEAEQRESLYDQRRLSANPVQRREGGNADNYERTRKTRLSTSVSERTHWNASATLRCSPKGGRSRRQSIQMIIERVISQ